MTVDLTPQEIQNLLTIIDASTIKGESAEAIVSLKNKLRSKAPEPQEPQPAE